MTPAQKSAFLEFVMRDIFAPRPRICSALFLKFGYHQNYFATAPSASHASNALTPTAYDDGQQAQQLILAQIVPQFAQGQLPSRVVPLFELGIGHEGEEPMFITEKAVSLMTLTLGHVFNIPLATENGHSIRLATNATPVVFHDRYGVPISLSKMQRIVGSSSGNRAGTTGGIV